MLNLDANLLCLVQEQVWSIIIPLSCQIPCVYILFGSGKGSGCIEVYICIHMVNMDLSAVCVAVPSDAAAVPGWQSSGSDRRAAARGEPGTAVALLHRPPGP